MLNAHAQDREERILQKAQWQRQKHIMQKVLWIQTQQKVYRMQQRSYLVCDSENVSTGMRGVSYKQHTEIPPSSKRLLSLPGLKSSST